MITTFGHFLLCSAACAATYAFIEAPQSSANDHRAAPSVEARPISSEAPGSTRPTLARFQEELLDLAFATASAIPPNPHLKDRSKAQAAVVAACLKLDQPARARTFLERISDWRRGLCLADLAFYSARHNDLSRIQDDLDRAAQLADREEDWRRDRIRAQIAGTYVLLGKPDIAASFDVNLVDAESGKADAAQSMVLEDSQFDQHVDSLDAILVAGGFDRARNAVDAFVELYRRFHADEARRAAIEAKIKAAWQRVPVSIQIHSLTSMARVALEHGNRADARRLVDEAQSMLDGAQWLPEDMVPSTAVLAGLRHRAGDTERARRDADAVLPQFEAQKDHILNIDWADALRPLAETYQLMGDSEAARAVYRRAVEVGIANPNSRPRAEDLAATLTSMAVHAFEPDEELWARLRHDHQALGHPW